MVNETVVGIYLVGGAVNYRVALQYLTQVSKTTEDTYDFLKQPITYRKRACLGKMPGYDSNYFVASVGDCFHHLEERSNLDQLQEEYPDAFLPHLQVFAEDIRLARSEFVIACKLPDPQAEPFTSRFQTKEQVDYPEVSEHHSQVRSGLACYWYHVNQYHMFHGQMAGN